MATPQSVRPSKERNSTNRKDKHMLLTMGCEYYKNKPKSKERTHVVQSALSQLDSSWNEARVRKYFSNHKARILDLLIEEAEEEEKAKGALLPSPVPRFVEQNRMFEELEASFRKMCLKDAAWAQAHESEYVIYTPDETVKGTYADWYQDKEAAESIDPPYYLGPVSEDPSKSSKPLRQYPQAIWTTKQVYHGLGEAKEPNYVHRHRPMVNYRLHAAGKTVAVGQAVLDTGAHVSQLDIAQLENGHFALGSKVDVAVVGTQTRFQEYLGVEVSSGGQKADNALGVLAVTALQRFNGMPYLIGADFISQMCVSLKPDKIIIRSPRLELQVDEDSDEDSAASSGQTDSGTPQFM